MESFSDSGQHLMSKQGSVFNLLPFLNGTEQLDLQLLSKRPYKVLEHIIFEVTLEDSALANLRFTLRK